MTTKKNKIPSVALQFPHTWLARLRQEMLNDLRTEHFCILLGKREDYKGGFVINVIEPLVPGSNAYQSNSLSHVSPRKDFVFYALSELQSRYDVDTLIDVHTHPFLTDRVHFSGVDDRDEIDFLRFLDENFDDLNYASIVFSQNEYSARYWPSGGTTPISASISTPTPLEEISNSQIPNGLTANVEADFHNRTMLALGRDVVQRITGARNIVVVGVGGLGSVIVENLVHMGFGKLTLVDHDVVKGTDLNRIVGATFQDAEKELLKVDVIKNHLLSIRPELDIVAIPRRVEDIEADERIALADWMIIATDSHSSRFHCQNIAFRYFIPFISSGVNITVNGEVVNDYSGEVIVVRPGDRICLNCLNRIDFIKKAEEENRGNKIGVTLASKYIDGAVVNEPAVKTLNSILGALTVEALLNQIAPRTNDAPVLVYEKNFHTCIYPDIESISSRNKNCFTCGIVRHW